MENRQMPNTQDATQESPAKGLLSRHSSMLIVGVLLGVVLTCGVFSLLPSPTDNEGSTNHRELQIAHALAESHPVHQGIVHLSERIAELSGGRLKLTIFPNEQLGNETECLEKVQRGSLAITKVSAAPLGNFVPRMKIFSLPYLFADEDHFWGVLAGPIGKQLLADLATRGDGTQTRMRGLCFFDAGSRSFYSQRPLLTPADLQGVKVRVMNDPVAMDMIEALGGSPAPISMGELYTALKQGVVDAAENNPPTFVASQHYDVCPHFTLDHHSRIPDVLVMSADVWESLSAEEQSWLQQAAQEASVYQRKAWEARTAIAIDVMIENGVTIHEVDQAAFSQAARSVTERYAEGDLRTLVEQIREIAP